MRALVIAMVLLGAVAMGWAQPVEEPAYVEDELDDRPTAPRPRADGADTAASVAVLLLALGVGYVFIRGGKDSDGGSWATYYLLWIVVPLVLGYALAQPLWLAIVVVGIAARPWLPDPVQWLTYARKTRQLEGQLAHNPHDAVARRALAEIWMVRHRPVRALEQLALARVREPDDLELRMLEGQNQALAGRHADAAATLLAIVERDPRFRYGDPALAAASALAAQRQWPAAEQAVRRCLAVNSSSVEAQVRLAHARRGQGDRAGATAARRAARQLYRELPPFQRRRQRQWYLRAVVGV